MDDDTPRAELAITALYTAHTWLWAGFDGATLLATDPARRVFNATNNVLWLARLLRPDAPSLRHSLAQRHQVIDHLVLASGCPQVLELACGLSPRGAALTAEPQVAVTEVDLPTVIAFKREQLARTPEGQAVLDRPNHHLVAADVTTTDLTALFDHDRPVCVVAEGLLMYLDAEARQALWTRLGALLHHPGSVLIFDLTPVPERPAPGVVGRMLGWMMRRFTRGRGMVQDDRDRHDLAGDLASLGLSATAFDPSTPPEGLALGWTDAPSQFVIWKVVRQDEQA